MFLNACRLGHKSVPSSKYRFKTKDECFHLTFLSGRGMGYSPLLSMLSLDRDSKIVEFVRCFTFSTLQSK